jgi:UTP--glucose-1-phosphate uridylyltransferase
MEIIFDRSWELEAMLRQRGKEDLLAKVRSVSEGKKIVFARQPEPLGLGHAVNCGEPFCRNDFFGVILPDDVMIGEPPVLSQLIAVHDRLGGSVVALEEVSENDTSRYGIVAAESAGGGVYRSLDLVEKPGPQNAPSRLAIMGRYILSPSIFRLIERVQPERAAKFS